MRFNPSHLSPLALRNASETMPLLKAGDSHPAVVDLQAALAQWINQSITAECGRNNEKGCDMPGQLDGSGYFGAATLATVLVLQKKSGLKDDGEVGKNTWAALGLEGSNSRPTSSELGPAPKDAAPIPSVDSLKGVTAKASSEGKPAIKKDEIAKAETPITKRAWFYPVVIGGGILLIGGAFLTVRKKGGMTRARANNPWGLDGMEYELAKLRQEQIKKDYKEAQGGGDLKKYALPIAVVLGVGAVAYVFTRKKG